MKDGNLFGVNVKYLLGNRGNLNEVYLEIVMKTKESKSQKVTQSLAGKVFKYNV